MSIARGQLPFPRGRTSCDFGLAGLTVSDTSLDELEGKTYEVLDDTHGTNSMVTLIVLKNDTGAAITPDNELYGFGTDAGDFGRCVDAVTAAQGQVCVPIDDAYGSDTAGDAGPNIPSDSLFYGVLKGPCYIKSGAANMALSAHDAVTCDAAGCLDDVAAAAGDFVIGVVDQAQAAEDAQTLVHVDIQLAQIAA